MNKSVILKSSMVCLTIISVIAFVRSFHKAVMNAIEEYDHSPEDKQYRGYFVDYHHDFKSRHRV
jgi:hypothetical protein